MDDAPPFIREIAKDEAMKKLGPLSYEAVIHPDLQLGGCRD